MEIETEAIEALARWYAREAGVRNLSKLVDKVRQELRVCLLLFLLLLSVGGVAVLLRTLLPDTLVYPCLSHRRRIGVLKSTPSPFIVVVRSVQVYFAVTPARPALY